jgi:hypothetical protein
MLQKPSANEYAPYYERYVALVPNDDVLKVLKEQIGTMAAALGSLPIGKETYRYAEGKWSIREVIGHLIDGERVFGYRAFCFSRGETAALPSFDENVYVARSTYDTRPLDRLIKEFSLLREANLAFLTELPPDQWAHMGTASGKQVSVRALAYIMAGHVSHHVAILHERYGVPGR